MSQHTSVLIARAHCSALKTNAKQCDETASIIAKQQVTNCVGICVRTGPGEGVLVSLRRRVSSTPRRPYRAVQRQCCVTRRCCGVCCATAVRSRRACAAHGAALPMACCSHDHDCEAASCGEASLYSHINHTGVTCLNAVDAAQGARVLRPWHERRARDACLESLEDDAELLLHIPFTTDVKARLSRLLGGSAGAYFSLSRSCAA